MSAFLQELLPLCFQAIPVSLCSVRQVLCLLSTVCQLISCFLRVALSEECGVIAGSVDFYDIKSTPQAMSGKSRQC